MNNILNNFKKFLLILIITLSILIVIGFVCFKQFDYEWAQIEEGRRQLYEKGICNYEEPCEWPY